jgi:hypothetical protein
MTQGTCERWTGSDLMEELQRFYQVHFGIALPKDVLFASEARMPGGAITRDYADPETMTVRVRQFEDRLAFEGTFGRLQSRSIRIVTFVLVLVHEGTAYFIYEVSSEPWSKNGIAHVMMTHALPRGEHQVRLLP